MQAVLYHHGVPKRADLLTRENRAWVGQLPLPAAGREQIAVGLAVTDAIDLRLAPFDRELCRYARRQPGCKALIGHRDRRADERHDPRRARRRQAVRLLASGGPLWRHGRRGARLRQAPRARAPLCHGPPALRWALYEAAQAPAARARRTATTSCKPPSGSDATAPAWRSRASCSNAATTPSKTSARRDSRPHELPSCAHAFSSSRCTAASSRHSAAATLAWDGLQRLSGCLALPHAGTPSPSCRRPGANPRSWTE